MSETAPQGPTIPSELLQKLIYGHVKRLVFERLGTLKGEFQLKELTHDEKLALAPAILDYIERATQEFIGEQRRRLTAGK